MKKIILILLAVVLGLTCFSGCGGTKYSENALLIYKEYNGAQGTEDHLVEEAIEKKFKEDTGYDIDLIVEATSSSLLGTKVVSAISTSSERIDGFITRYSSDGPLISYILDGEVKDLTDIIDEVGQEYKGWFNEEYDPGKKAFYAGALENKIYSLSSLYETSAWGVLVRKDYMANTDFDPDEYDIFNPNYKSLSVDEFKELLVQLKERNEMVERPLVGSPWNVDEIVSPAFGTVCYTDNVLEDGMLLPAYATEEYEKLLEFERELQEEKLWVEQATSSSNPLQYFISGKGAVYIAWSGVIEQIGVAADLKDATGADCIMLAPLLKEGSETETNGNLRVRRAYMGLVVPHKGQNTDLLVRYMNWMWSSKENYELCRYGIEGQHWVKKDVDGKELYDYPEDRKEEFKNSTVYSGKFCLLENDELSNRIYAGYSDQEMSWIEKVRAFPSYPSEGYVDEGVLLPPVPVQDRELRKISSALSQEYTSVRAYAWCDAEIPNGGTILSLWTELRNGVFDSDKYKPYIDYNTENYWNIIESRK